ncbi:MAG: AMP-binding protein, partial [Rhizobium sp.]|nr:AMP-binding protein [Rhizobium sp.]
MFLPEFASYDAIYREFSWQIPPNFNIGRAVSDDWALKHPDRVCLEHFSPDGRHLSMTYGELTAKSAAFANALIALGITRGDRVALLLPQSFETVIAHVAIYKMGAIALPLALLFGVEALEYRLSAAGARAVITNDFGLSRLDEIRPCLPALEHVISTGARSGAVHSFDHLVDTHPSVLEVAETGPDTAALMIFTSGTTGPPKGALHGHRVLPGHIPGFQMVHDFLP